MSATQKSVRDATSTPRIQAEQQERRAHARGASLFVPGRNCTRVAHADRVSLIVDGEAYFKAFVAAAEQAQRSIFIVGWDFHSRTRLHLDSSSDLPELLGDFLNFLVKRRRSLDVHVLIWDYPMIFAKGREMSPIYGFGWRPRRRVHVCYDDHYPIGASQHQKIVTIDGGSIAFCGGLDLTRSRWDTCEHKPGDVRRVNVGEDKPYAPFHDTMMAVDGEAARALDQVVRATMGTGDSAPGRSAFSRTATCGRRNCTVSVKNVDVAIARTVASMRNEPPVNEVEALYLDMIAAAKQSIYIENQYFTSNSLGEALLKRLQEPDGPEIIAVHAAVDGRLARSALDGHAAHGAAAQAARCGYAQALPPVLPAPSLSARRAVLRSAFEADDRRRRMRAHRLRELLQPLDGARHGVRRRDRGARRCARCGERPRVPQPPARRASRQGAGRGRCEASRAGLARAARSMR